MKQYYADNCEKLKPPVYIFLTAFSTPAFKAYTSTFGVSACLEKPVSIGQLRALIKQEFKPPGNVIEKAPNTGHIAAMSSRKPNKEGNEMIDEEEFDLDCEEMFLER